MTDITPTRRELADIARRRHVKEARQKAKAERPVSPKKDRGRERNNAYLAFLRRQPCCVRHLGFCGGPVEAAHIRTPDPKRGKPLTGMQVKPDDKWATPLCRIHHAAQHSIEQHVISVGRDRLLRAADRSVCRPEANTRHQLVVVVGARTSMGTSARGRSAPAGDLRAFRRQRSPSMTRAPLTAEGLFAQFNGERP